MHWLARFIIYLVVAASIYCLAVPSRRYGILCSNYSPPSITIMLVVQQISTSCSMMSTFALYAIWPFKPEKCRVATISRCIAAIFSASPRHRLSVLLTSIKGYAELLQAYGIADNSIKEMTPARQRQYLATIMEQAEHMEVLISDLLDMSRIQAGRLALRFTQVDVAYLCQRVAELAQRRVDQQQPEQYSIRCLLDPQLPLAWADPDRLEQVLTNLLENAIKYSPDGGTIELLVSASHTTHPAH